MQEVSIYFKCKLHNFDNFPFFINFAEEIRNDFDWKFSRELTCGDFCVNVG